MDRLEVRGAMLAFEEAGEGEPLVLVHGSVSDLRSWSGLLSRFGKSHRAIAYSRRYHWPNARIPAGADYDMQEHAEDLAALLRAACDGPAHVVGHSYGAYVALLVALANPDAVRSLVLAEPPAVPLLVNMPPGPGELLRLLITRPLTAAAVLKFGVLGVRRATASLEKGDRETAMRRFGEAVLGKQAFDALTDERRSWVRDNMIEAEFLGSDFPPLDEARVSCLDIPTLLLGSAHSPRLFDLILDRLEELIPEAERAEIGDASHIMHEDNPDDYFRTTMKFLTRVSSIGRERGPDQPA